MFEDHIDDVLVHGVTIFHCLIIATHPLEADPLPYLLLNELVNVDCYVIFNTFLKEVQELVLHCRRAHYQAWPRSTYYLQDFPEGGLVRYEYLVNLIDGHELTVLQIHVASLMSVEERLWLADYDICRLMCFLVQFAHCEF